MTKGEVNPFYSPVNSASLPGAVVIMERGVNPSLSYHCFPVAVAFVLSMMCGSSEVCVPSSERAGAKGGLTSSRMHLGRCRPRPNDPARLLPLLVQVPEWCLPLPTRLC